MTPEEFFNKVAAMRAAQKEYFRTRSTTKLNECKALEREIDAEINRVNAVIEERKRGTQLKLSF